MTEFSQVAQCGVTVPVPGSSAAGGPGAGEQRDCWLPRARGAQGAEPVAPGAHLLPASAVARPVPAARGSQRRRKRLSGPFGR